MKKPIALIVCIMTVALLAACQPTPDKPVVIEKNDLEQKIMQTADPQQSPEIPETWKETLNFQSGVQVVVEADIDKPQVAVYPVLDAKPHEFLQEETQTFADYFMKGLSLYKNEYVRVKADVQNDIVIVQSYIDKTKTKKYTSEAGRQADIDRYNELLTQLKEEYANVPEKDPEPEPTAICFEEYQDTSSGIYKYLSVKAYVGDGSPAALSVAILDNLESHIRFQDNSDILYGWNIDATDSLVGITTSMSQAQATAERVLQDIGITDIKLEEKEAKVEIKYTDDAETISTAADDPDRKKCFIFHYIPVHEGIPVTIVEPCYGMESENSGSEQYDRPWASEEIIISVNDSGVIAFQWDSPGDIVRTVNENVLLMNFEVIKEIFRKQMFYQRTWTFPGIQENGITIKTIKLGYMRVKVKDENKYYMLPVWDFIGDWTYTVRSQENSIENVSFLTLNAIDGSVIDRNLGY